MRCGEGGEGQDRRRGARWAAGIASPNCHLASPHSSATLPPLHSPPPSPREAAWNPPQVVPFPPLTMHSYVKMFFFPTWLDEVKLRTPLSLLTHCPSLTAQIPTPKDVSGSSSLQISNFFCLWYCPQSLQPPHTPQKKYYQEPTLSSEAPYSYIPVFN